jgi:hypothetical protein
MSQFTSRHYVVPSLCLTIKGSAKWNKNPEKKRQNISEKYFPRSVYDEYTDLRPSQNWFFKWLKRYQAGVPGCQSKAMLNRQIQTIETVETFDYHLNCSK